MRNCGEEGVALTCAPTPNQAPTGSTDKLSINYLVKTRHLSLLSTPVSPPPYPPTRGPPGNLALKSHISLRSIFPIISSSFYASFYSALGIKQT